VTNHSAMIATINPVRGDVTGIHCSMGGSPREMLQLLPLFYARRGLSRRLVRLGSIQSLGHRLVPFSDRHTFDDPETGTTLAYVRDGGAPRRAPHLAVRRPDIRALTKFADESNCQFIYLHDRRGRWYWQRVGPKLHNWIMLPLTQKSVDAFYGTPS
jgi:hypothetical protein